MNKSITWLQKEPTLLNSSVFDPIIREKIKNTKNKKKNKPTS